MEPQNLKRTFKLFSTVFPFSFVVKLIRNVMTQRCARKGELRVNRGLEWVTQLLERERQFIACPYTIPVFPNRRAAARYRALASIIPGRER
jgi:hypothetical protein